MQKERTFVIGLLAIVAGIAGVIYFVVASWLWNLNPSGWLFVLVVSIINIIFRVLALIGQTSFGDVAVQLAVNAVVLIPALLPSTKKAFPPTVSPKAAAAAPERAAGTATDVDSDATKAIGREMTGQPTRRRRYEPRERWNESL